MKTLLRRTLPLLAVTLGILVAGPALAQPTDALKACLIKVAEQDLAAKVDFQNGLAHLVGETHPEFSELVGLNRDLQVALARAREIRLAYLIDKDPVRFVKASSLTRFSNFEWIGTDEDALAAQNPDYAALMEQIETMTAENEVHKDWDGLRAAFTELQQGDEFMKIFETYNAARAKAEERLEAC